MQGGAAVFLLAKHSLSTKSFGKPQRRQVEQDRLSISTIRSGPIRKTLPARPVRRRNRRRPAIWAPLFYSAFALVSIGSSAKMIGGSYRRFCLHGSLHALDQNPGSRICASTVHNAKALGSQFGSGCFVGTIIWSGPSESQPILYTSRARSSNELFFFGRLTCRAALLNNFELGDSTTLGRNVGGRGNLASSNCACWTRRSSSSASATRRAKSLRSALRPQFRR